MSSCNSCCQSCAHGGPCEGSSKTISYSRWGSPNSEQPSLLELFKQGRKEAFAKRAEDLAYSSNLPTVATDQIELLSGQLITGQIPFHEYVSHLVHLGDAHQDVEFLAEVYPVYSYHHKKWIYIILGTLGVAYLAQTGRIRLPF